MLRVGLVGLMCLFFCSCKKLATPLEFAESQVGVEEGSPSIWRYLLPVPDRQNVSEEEWCAAFADWCLSSAGYALPKTSLVSGWQDHGLEVRQPKLGDIAVLWGHVGFYYGKNKDGQVLLLGGNQGYRSHLPTSVSVIPIDESVVLEYRRPVRLINVRGEK
jgi:uncharacterized protein (TIGR02594 family)